MKSRKCAKCGLSSKDERKFTFHRFPPANVKNVERLQKWAKWIYPEKSFASIESLLALYKKNKILCSQHFTKGMIYGNGQLSKFAVPCLEAPHETLEPRTAAASLAQTQTLPSDRMEPPAAAERLVRKDAVFSRNGEIDPLSSSTKQKIADCDEEKDSEMVYDNMQESKEEVESKQEQTDATLERVCRACLRYCTDAQEMTPLVIDDQLTETGEALTRLSLQIVQITANDDLPKQFCADCANEVIRAERFCRRVEATHARLATVAPEEIVQYSLSLAHYFPDRFAGERDLYDDETSVTLRYDGEQLEVWFDAASDTARCPTELVGCPVDGQYRRTACRTDDGASEPKRLKTNQSTKKNPPSSIVPAAERINDSSDTNKRKATDGDKTNAGPLKEVLETPCRTQTERMPKNKSDGNKRRNERCPTSVDCSVNASDVQHDGIKEQAVDELAQQIKEEDVDTDDLAQQIKVEDVDTDDLVEASDEQLLYDFETTFRCSECHMDFMTRLECENHMNAAHGSVRTYVCHECGQTIATKRQLREHLLQHMGGTPYECRHCNVMFYSRRDLRGHYAFCGLTSSNKTFTFD